MTLVTRIFARPLAGPLRGAAGRRSGRAAAGLRGNVEREAVPGSDKSRVPRLGRRGAGMPLSPEALAAIRDPAGALTAPDATRRRVPAVGP